jgi:hypothetical protein
MRTMDISPEGSIGMPSQRVDHIRSQRLYAVNLAAVRRGCIGSAPHTVKIPHRKTGATILHHLVISGACRHKLNSSMHRT